MSTIIDRARSGTRWIMEQFDSEEAELLRAEKDKYGQNTGVWSPIGTARLWLNGPTKPDKWKLKTAGIVYDDNGTIWAAMLGDDDPPEAKHEDRVRLADGREFTVRNTFADAARIRVFWQLEAV